MFFFWHVIIFIYFVPIKYQMKETSHFLPYRARVEQENQVIWSKAYVIIAAVTPMANVKNYWLIGGWYRFFGFVLI